MHATASLMFVKYARKNFQEIATCKHISRCIHTKASCLWNMQQGIFPEKWPKEASSDTYTVCEMCKKEFSGKDHLKTHFLTNTGDKPHVWEAYKKGFLRTLTYYVHLHTHFLTHTGKKLHVCDIWNNAFPQKCNLNKHFQEKPYISWNMQWRIFRERCLKKASPDTCRWKASCLLNL